jgi:hypothetical protein
MAADSPHQAGRRSGVQVKRGASIAVIEATGWISFDPTNRGMGGSNLIPVAVDVVIDRLPGVFGHLGPGTPVFSGAPLRARRRIRAAKHPPP